MMFLCGEVTFAPPCRCCTVTNLAFARSIPVLNIKFLTHNVICSLKRSHFSIRNNLSLFLAFNLKKSSRVGVEARKSLLI